MMMNLRPYRSQLKLSAAAVALLCLTACSDPEAAAGQNIEEINSAFSALKSSSSYSERLTALKKIQDFLGKLDDEAKQTKAFAEWEKSRPDGLDSQKVASAINKMENGPEGCVQSLTRECVKKSIAILTDEIAELVPGKKEFFKISSLVDTGKFAEAEALVDRSSVNPSVYQRELRMFISALRGAESSSGRDEVLRKAAINYGNLSVGAPSQWVQQLQNDVTNIVRPNDVGKIEELSDADRILLAVYAKSALKILDGSNLDTERSAKFKAGFLPYLAIIQEADTAKKMATEIQPHLDKYAAKPLFTSLAILTFDRSSSNDGLDYLEKALSSLDKSSRSWPSDAFEIRNELATKLYLAWFSKHVKDEKANPWRDPEAAFKSIPTINDIDAVRALIKQIYPGTPAGLAMHEVNMTRLDYMMAELGLLYQLNEDREKADAAFKEAEEAFEVMRFAHGEALAGIRRKEEPLLKNRGGLSLREGYLAMMRGQNELGLVKLVDTFSSFANNHALSGWVLAAAAKSDQLQQAQAAMTQAQTNKTPEQIYDLIARGAIAGGNKKLALQYIDSADNPAQKNQLRWAYLERLASEPGGFKKMKEAIEGFGWEQATGRPVVFGYCLLAKASFNDAPDADRSSIYETALEAGKRSREEQEPWWRSAIAFRALETKDLDAAISIIEPSEWVPAPAFYYEAMTQSRTKDDLQKILQFLVRRTEAFHTEMDEIVKQNPQAAKRAMEEKARTLDTMKRLFQQAVGHAAIDARG